MGTKNDPGKYDCYEVMPNCSKHGPYYPEFPGCPICRQIGRITLNYLLVMAGSVSAGFAAYQFTGEPFIGVLTFGAAVGLVGAVV